MNLVQPHPDSPLLMPRPTEARNVAVWSPHTEPATVIAGKPSCFPSVLLYVCYPILKGFYQHGTITIAMFHSWLHNLLIVSECWCLFIANDLGKPISSAYLNPNDIGVLPTGNYAALSRGTSPNPNYSERSCDLSIRRSSSIGGNPLEIQLTSETHRPRTLSLDVTGTARVCLKIFMSAISPS